MAAPNWSGSYGRVGLNAEGKCSHSPTECVLASSLASYLTIKYSWKEIVCTGDILQAAQLVSRPERLDMPTLSSSPDIRRRLKERLLALPPRAFELFAGELLTFIGLQDVTVTNYVGDNGIDANGVLVGESGLVRVPTGVQVKRHRQNVQRPDMDRFIGALGGRFHHGIFITTAGYAPQALEKARTSPLVRVDTVSGEAVVALMRQHRLGLTPDESLDEAYFVAFESQAPVRRGTCDEREKYEAGDSTLLPVPPEEDLITLRALSYLLRVDPTTIRDWIERGRLKPDSHTGAGQGEGVFFRRDRVEGIRISVGSGKRPVTGAEWRQEFLDFARSRNLTKSYKPVLLKALIRLVDRHGEVHLEALVADFHAFYLDRHRQGLPVEFEVPLLSNPTLVSKAALRRLVLRYPLDRFLIQGFLEFDPSTEIVRFAPTLWSELRAHELLEVLTSADEQLHYYYSRGIALS